MSRPPCSWCQCQCKPKTLLQWEGDAPWDVVTGFDGLPSVQAQLKRIRYKKNHQVRVLFDDTNAAWASNWYLSGDYLTTPLPTWQGGGTLRDGIPFGIGAPGSSHWGSFPWRLELGCIPCRSCPCSAGNSPPSGGMIYWPKREQVTTTPIWSGVYPNNYISDVTQTTSTADGDYGRAPTADEISRHHWWGNKAYGKPAETRRCPPDVIVWNHAFGSATGLNYPPEPTDGQQMYGDLSTDVSVHRANGFADIYPQAASTNSQRFEDVDLTGVNAIRLTSTMFHDMSLTVSGGPPVNPPADVSDVTASGYQAITDWLDEGDKTLIIDGSAGWRDNFPAFVAKFCGISVSALTAEEVSIIIHYQIGTYSPMTCRFEARDHELANYPGTHNLPIFNASDVYRIIYKIASGGETLYDFTYDVPEISTAGSFAAVAVETLASGSRVIVSPFQVVTAQHPTPTPTSNWTFQWGVRALL